MDLHHVHLFCTDIEATEGAFSTQNEHVGHNGMLAQAHTANESKKPASPKPRTIGVA